MLDLPGIIEGASEGRGRGRQVISVAKSADLVIMVLDATKDDAQRNKLEHELEAVGIRLNKEPPQISVKPKKMGGIHFNSTCKLTKMDEKLCHSILSEYKMFNADVLFRADHDADDLIDAIEGNRKYVRCLYVYNKIDMLNLAEIERLARKPMSVVVSSQRLWNLDTLLERIWECLALVRIYTKKQGQPVDMDDPVILTPQRGGSTVENAVSHIHRDLLKDMKCALVWGTSAPRCRDAFTPQMVGVKHLLEDEDVIQIVKAHV